MKEEKKNLPMNPGDQEKMKTLEFVFGDAAAARAFALVGNFTQVQIALILKELHDDDKYKKLGYGTWDEVCKKCGISKPHSYRLLDNLKTLGPKRMEFLYNAGLSTHAQYFLLKGTGEIEDAEFEVLSDDEIKIDGRKFSISDNPEEAIECLCRLKHERDTERRARSDIERELEETKKDLENKKRKIEVGVKDEERARRRAAGFQEETVTKIGRMVCEMTYLAGKITQEEVTPEDIPFLLRYLEIIDRQCCQRVADKFSPHLPEDPDAI